MLCLRGRQQAKDLLVDLRREAIGRNKHCKNARSYDVSLALVILLVDWPISHRHSRVFLSKSPENTDTQDTLSGRHDAALSPTPASAWPYCYARSWWVRVVFGPHLKSR